MTTTDPSNGFYGTRWPRLVVSALLIIALRTTLPESGSRWASAARAWGVIRPQAPSGSTWRRCSPRSRRS